MRWPGDAQHCRQSGTIRSHADAESIIWCGGSHVDLITETVVDCTGRATHRLYLRLDGTVEIIDAYRNRARVDPAHRVCLTPGVSVAPHVMDIAMTMGAMGLR